MRAMSLFLGSSLLLILWGCNPTSVSGPASLYPPRLPESARRPGLPAWLHTPQRWKVGDWVDWRDPHGVIKKGNRRIQLIERTKTGEELWEVVVWAKKTPKKIHYLVIGGRPSYRSLLFSYTIGPDGATSSTSPWEIMSIVRDIRNGFDYLRDNRVFPKKSEFDKSVVERDDVRIGGRKVRTLRISYTKKMGPAKVMMFIWVSHLFPGKILRVKAKGYLLGMRLLQRSGSAVAFGRDEKARPRVRLPLYMWPPQRALASEGGKCKSHGDCRKGLRCVSGSCRDLSGSSSACKWALACLGKLTSTSHPDNDPRKAARLRRGLAGFPERVRCLAMAEEGIPRAFAPWVWKPVCGPPPITSVQRKGEGTPFKILDSKIMASMIPGDDPYYKKRTERIKSPDLCKAWVKLKLTREFQGRLVAVFFKEHDCKKVRVRKGRRYTYELKCLTKRYQRTDAYHYIYLTPPSTELTLSFYVETPFEEVCKDRTKKKYPTGCFCLGLSNTRIEIEAQEDPFIVPADRSVAREKAASRPPPE